MGHESRIELWSPLDRRSALLVSELTGLRCEEAMKTAGRENPNRWATLLSNRAPGAARLNRPCSIQWAEKQYKGVNQEFCAVRIGVGGTTISTSPVATS
jgi:hypothetical protein